MFLGLASKYLALVVKNMSTTVDCLGASLPYIFNNHSEEAEKIRKIGNDCGIKTNTEINFPYIIEQFKSGLPFWIGIFVSKGFKRGSKDWLYANKRIAKYTCFQGLLTGLQTLIIIFSIFLISCSLKITNPSPHQAASQPSATLPQGESD
jgi:hypothetical protein